MPFEFKELRAPSPVIVPQANFMGGIRTRRAAP